MTLETDNNAEPNTNPPKLDRPVVLVGLMGAGKSCVGRRLAESFGLPFVDSDGEVETAAGCDIRDIFEVYGEPAFRDCERRVIQRLLEASGRIRQLPATHHTAPTHLASYVAPLHKTITRQSQDNHKTTHKTTPFTSQFLHLR